MHPFLAVSSVILFLALPTAAAALEVKEYQASAVEVAAGTATLLSHESVLLGLSCSSGPVGDLPNLKQIRLGDTIRLKNYSFRVGLIKVIEYLEDASWGGNTIAKKGDIECVAAAEEESLPYEDDCEALWVRIPQCSPLR